MKRPLLTYDDFVRLLGNVQRGPRLSERVADRILGVIVQLRLDPGDLLPTERRLAQHFNVSRTIVREALHTLAAKGIVDVKPGSGAHVGLMHSDVVQEAVGLYLHGHGPVDYGQVHEARRLLEIHVAGLAAKRRTNGQVAALWAALEGFEAAVTADDVDATVEADVAFHRALAACTQNDVYKILLDSIAGPLTAYRRKTHPNARLAVDAHRAILRAVERGDEVEAQSAMSAHLDSVERTWGLMFEENVTRRSAE